MPAETTRLQRRIAARDRWFFALLAAAALVGTPIAVVLSRHDPRPSTGPPCVATIRASIMGGATFTYCGAAAVAFCRQSAATDKGIAAQCEKVVLTRRRR